MGLSDGVISIVARVIGVVIKISCFESRRAGIGGLLCDWGRFFRTFGCFCGWECLPGICLLPQGEFWGYGGGLIGGNPGFFVVWGGVIGGFGEELGG